MRDKLSVIRRALRESECAPPTPLLAATVAFVASAFAAKLRSFLARRSEARIDRWIADELAAVEAAFAAEARTESAEKPSASAAERRREGRRRRGDDRSPPVSVSPRVSTIHEEEDDDLETEQDNDEGRGSSFGAKRLTFDDDDVPERRDVPNLSDITNSARATAVTATRRRAPAASAARVHPAHLDVRRLNSFPRRTRVI